MIFKQWITFVKIFLSWDNRDTIKFNLEMYINTMSLRDLADSSAQWIFANSISRRAINCRSLWLVNRVIFASVILHLIAPNSQTANHCRHNPPRVFARRIGIKLAISCLALRNLRSSEIGTRTLDKYARSQHIHTLLHTLPLVRAVLSFFRSTHRYFSCNYLWHEQRGMYNDTCARSTASKCINAIRLR